MEGGWSEGGSEQCLLSCEDSESWICDDDDDGLEGGDGRGYHAGGPRAVVALA